ncbi:MAG TPA: hypothetical protein VFN99_02055 [Gaiella sp.]|nr:hypothetical protein [Gaiella sp.]
MSETAPDTQADEALERLERQVSALRDDVRRLASAAALPQSQPETPVTPAAYAWLGALEPPTRRRPQVPRLLLEGLFLAAAATVAAVAELDPVAIAGVMVGAWVLVALIEWAASRAERRPDAGFYAPAAAPAAPLADPAWFSPPVEQTLLDAGDTGNVTEVTRLPAPEDEEIEATAEQRP